MVTHPNRLWLAPRDHRGPSALAPIAKRPAVLRDATRSTNVFRTRSSESKISSQIVLGRARRYWKADATPAGRNVAGTRGDLERGRAGAIPCRSGEPSPIRICRPKRHRRGYRSAPNVTTQSASSQASPFVRRVATRRATTAAEAANSQISPSGRRRSCGKGAQARLWLVAGARMVGIVDGAPGRTRGRGDCRTIAVVISTTKSQVDGDSGAISWHSGKGSRPPRTDRCQGVRNSFFLR